MVTEQQIRDRLDALAKPQGSLGKLENVAARLALVQQRLDPVTRPRCITLFAADHGVVAQGVSAWSSAVTGLMVDTIRAGHATSNALAAAQDCALRLVDVGSAGEPKGAGPDFFRAAKVESGTADLSVEPAMTVAQFDTAWGIGAEEARHALAAGNAVLITGEMGIGNTTAAACLTALLAGLDPTEAVGRGAGADETVLAAKQRVVQQAVGRARLLFASDQKAAIAAVSGFEIVAMAGFIAAAANAGSTLLLDGYVATAAALIAEQLAPGSARCLIAAHLSAEPGHAAALAQLGLEPLLEWQMRLGEGTGALVALPLLDSAAALLTKVALLADLGI